MSNKYLEKIAEQLEKQSSEHKPSPVGIKPSHKGKLHKALGIPEGQKIPLAKLHEAKNSKDPHMKRMANYAINARKWKHEGNKK